MEEECVGFIIDKSLKHQDLLKTLRVVEQKPALWGLVHLYKVIVEKDQLEEWIKILQNDLVKKIGLINKEFYIHFYRGEELIVIYSDKIFRVRKDPTTWGEVIKHGRALGIPRRQLDFLPYLK